MNQEDCAECGKALEDVPDYVCIPEENRCVCTDCLDGVGVNIYDWDGDI